MLHLEGMHRSFSFFAQVLTSTSHRLIRSGSRSLPGSMNGSRRWESRTVRSRSSSRRQTCNGRRTTLRVLLLRSLGSLTRMLDLAARRLPSRTSQLDYCRLLTGHFLVVRPLLNRRSLSVPPRRQSCIPTMRSGFAATATCLFVSTSGVR